MLEVKKEENTKIIPEDRQWAFGLDFNEYVIEFQRRFPNADIPPQDSYIYPDNAGFKGIFGLNAENYELQDGIHRTIETVEVNKVVGGEDYLFCSKCKKAIDPIRRRGKSVPNKLGLYNHEKNCKG